MATEILVFQMKSYYFLIFCGLITLYEHYGSLQTLRCSDWWRNHEGVFCHPLNHSPSNSKEKTTRQTENHSQFFRRNGIYTPLHILLPFDFFDSWFWKWVKCMAIIFWFSSDPSYTPARTYFIIGLKSRVLKSTV